MGLQSSRRCPIRDKIGSNPDRERESERVTLMDMILRSDYQACHDASQPHHPPLPPFPPDKYGDYDPNTRIPQLCVLHCLHRPRASGFLVRWEGEREAERGPRPMMIIPRRPAAAAGLPPRATFPYYYGCCISYLRMQAWYCGRGRGKRCRRGGGASCINYPNEDWAQPT